MPAPRDDFNPVLISTMPGWMSMRFASVGEFPLVHVRILSGTTAFAGFLDLHQML